VRSEPQTSLKPSSVLVTIVFYILTVGLYLSIWYLRRRAALNQLKSSTKIRRWPFFTYFAFITFDLLVSLVDTSALPEQAAAATAGVLELSGLAVWILMVVQSFSVKAILEEHLARPKDDGSPSLFRERVKLSVMMTFFFQIFYLQYAINRHISALQPQGGMTGSLRPGSPRT
jgi:hypothetical protein